MSRTISAVLACGIMVVLSAESARAADVRQPKYPLKTARTLWSDEQIVRGRENVRRYPQAKKIADEIIKQADEWAAWKDQDLIELITDSRVPRAFETGTAGCPKCGHAIYQKF